MVRSGKPKSSGAGAKMARSVARPEKRPKSTASRTKKTQQPKRANVAKTAEALCPVADRCGGCSAIDVPYEVQLARKQERIEELFAPLETAVKPAPIIGMENPFHYRNKVATPYAPARSRGRGDHARPQHRVLTGMYARGTHQLIPTDACLIENEGAKKVTLVIRDLMEKWDIAPYDEDTGRGFLRHAVVRVGHRSGEMLVTLVTNGNEFPKAKSFCRELVRRAPAVTTVVQNVNTRKTNVILGETARTLYGPGFILDELCGVKFRISSKSFYQVNSQQTEVLYCTAMQLAKLDELGEGDTIIDAYCGTGTIGLVAARQCSAQLVGVDSVTSAIRDARLNAQHNGIENAEFVCDDATEFMVEVSSGRRGRGGPCSSILAEGDRPERGGAMGFRSMRRRREPRSRSSFGLTSLHPTAPPLMQEHHASEESGATAELTSRCILFMDPPRAGATPQFIDAACTLVPERIVYISCDPTTQVRDVERFLASGLYELKAIQPVDMFPHTDHIENICVLEKGSDV